MEAGRMSFKTSDEENGEQNTRCVRMSVDITIALTFTRIALFPLRAVKFGRKLECFEGPTSSFRQAFCHPAHHPHDLSLQSWEVGVGTDRILSEVTLTCSAIPSLSQTRKTAEPEVSGMGYGVLDRSPPASLPRQDPPAMASLKLLLVSPNSTRENRRLFLKPLRIVRLFTPYGAETVRDGA